TQTFTLTVAGVVTKKPSFTSAASATFAVGQSGSFTVTTTGYPVAKLSQTGTLPAGVTFVDNGNGTATLSGTPLALSGTPPVAVAGSYTLTITATASGFPPVKQTFKLTV